MTKEELLCNPEYQKILAVIDKEVDYVDDKQYSHNIISLALRQAADAFGNEVANDIIVEFELEELGWSQIDKEEI